MNFYELNNHLNCRNQAIQWLESNGYQLTESNIKIIVEGFMSNMGNKFKMGFLAPAALAAGLGGSAYADVPTQKTYSASIDTLRANPTGIQKDNELLAHYAKHGNFPQKDMSSEKGHYIQAVTIIKEVGSAQNLFVDVIQSKNMDDGEILLILDISARVTAYSEFTAKEKFVKIIKEELRRNGFMAIEETKFTGGNQNWADKINLTQSESVNRHLYNIILRIKKAN